MIIWCGKSKVKAGMRKIVGCNVPWCIHQFGLLCACLLWIQTAAVTCDVRMEKNIISLLQKSLSLDYYGSRKRSAYSLNRDRLSWESTTFLLHVLLTQFFMTVFFQSPEHTEATEGKSHTTPPLIKIRITYGVKDMVLPWRVSMLERFDSIPFQLKILFITDIIKHLHVNKANV